MLPPSEARTPRAGHVGDVGSGDLDDLGARPAGDGQPGDLGDHRLAVGARREDRERPVHLEPELSHRPDRVQFLHLGHRDPCGCALGRIIQHDPVHGVLPGGEPGDLPVHRGKGVHFAACGICPSKSGHKKDLARCLGSATPAQAKRSVATISAVATPSIAIATPAVIRRTISPPR